MGSLQLTTSAQPDYKIKSEKMKYEIKELYENTQ